MAETESDARFSTTQLSRRQRQIAERKRAATLLCVGELMNAASAPIEEPFKCLIFLVSLIHGCDKTVA